MLIHHFMHGLKVGRRRIVEFVVGLPFLFIAFCVWIMELFESEEG